MSEGLLVVCPGSMYQKASYSTTSWGPEVLALPLQRTLLALLEKLSCQFVHSLLALLCTSSYCFTRALLDILTGIANSASTSLLALLLLDTTALLVLYLMYLLAWPTTPRRRRDARALPPPRAFSVRVE